MDEIRLKVTLTNAGDEAMVRRGLLSTDQVRHCEADALVGSGGFRSVLPIHVVERLGLATVGTIKAICVNNGVEDVGIAEVVSIDIDGRSTAVEALVRGSEVMIGEAVLATLDLQVDRIHHRIIPNPAHQSQPVVRV